MQHLVEQAIVGTARLPTSQSADHPAIALVDRAAATAAERRLLLAAGVASIYETAGRLATTAPELPEPAAPQSQVECNSSAAALMDDLLGRAIVDQPLLVEACELLLEARQILPPALLFRALEIPNRKELRAAVRRVLGERGRWLAQFNDNWQWARHHAEVAETAEPPSAEAETVWQEGELPARAELLGKIRQQDAARARRWLADVWNTEKADARVALLAAFTAMPTADDIPLLELALKDRSAAVRSAATVALATIKDSPLSARMVERAGSMLAYQEPAKGGVGLALKRMVRGKASVGSLVVALPAELPQDWRLDGIEAKPPQGRGERAHWLVQVVSLVSPEHWNQRTSLSAAEVVEAASQTEHSAALIEAFANAALTFHATDWLTAVCDHGLAHVPAKREPGGIDWVNLLPRLLSAMPAADAEQRLARLLAGPATHAWDLPTLLQAIATPWSEAFGHNYLRWFWKLAKNVDVRSSEAQRAWSTLPQAALALPPACFAAALSEPPAALEESSHRYWLNELTKCQETLRLRKRLREAISGS